MRTNATEARLRQRKMHVTKVLVSSQKTVALQYPKFITVIIFSFRLNYLKKYFLLNCQISSVHVQIGSPGFKHRAKSPTDTPPAPLTSPQSL